MARPGRFERPADWFVASYSIQLSYGRVFFENPYPLGFASGLINGSTSIELSLDFTRDKFAPNKQKILL